VKERLPHQRSKEGNEKQQQRRTAHQFRLQYSYLDRILAETIDLTTPEMTKNMLQAKYGFSFPCAYNESERGQVLMDSRGRGVEQR
jgi:hexokinase